MRRRWDRDHWIAGELNHPRGWPLGEGLGVRARSVGKEGERERCFVRARPSPQPSPKGRGRQELMSVLLNMHRFTFCIAIALFVSLALIAYGGRDARALGEQRLDILILHGKLVDGSGRKPR